MGVLDMDELGKLAAATCEELDVFVKMGFPIQQIDRERAAKTLEAVVKKRLKKV